MSESKSDSLEEMAAGLGEKEKQVLSSLKLLNPDLLTAQYKNSKGLASEARTYATAGNQEVARNRFESAAKLALYEGDAGSAKSYLEKAIGLDENSKFSIALSNFDKISKYVITSYKSQGRVT